ncbi:MAG TPA: hypothetical protein VFQ61_31410 [Polyangiaceae bacterium]|nr:hypothetical protein [Polyangiaceae bacterium]
MLSACLFCSRMAFGEENAGLTLESGSPDALCPDLTRARAAVERRLGRFEFPSGPAWKARYTLGHRPEGEPRDFVQLELFDGQGQLKLRRELPTANESCVTLAEVIALVLDRYFRALSGEEGGLAPLAEGVPETNSRSPEPREREPVDPVQRDSSTVQLGSQTSPRTAAPVRAMLGASLGVSSSGADAHLTLKGLFAAFPGSYWSASLRTPLARRFESLSEDRYVSTRELVAGGSLGLVGDSAGFRLFAGPTLGLGVERASGVFRESSAKYRAMWSLGAEAGAIYKPGGRLLAFAHGALELPLARWSGQFYVDDREVLRLPRVQALFSLGLGVELSN